MKEEKMKELLGIPFERNGVSFKEAIMMSLEIVKWAISSGMKADDAIAFLQDTIYDKV